MKPNAANDNAIASQSVFRSAGVGSEMGRRGRPVKTGLDSVLETLQVRSQL